MGTQTGYTQAKTKGGVMTAFKKAFVVQTDGANYVLEFNDETSLKVMQGVVGGLIQPIDFGFTADTMTMWVNEEGKLIDLPVNQFGTLFYQRYFGATDIIVGDIVFTGGTDKDGYTLGLEAEQIELLRAILDRLAQVFASTEQP